MEAEPLAAACELAFAVAREGEKAVPPIEPPAAMRNYLYVAQLPRRAMTVAQRAIEEDPTFRRRVAAEATEQAVGRAGYLWLTRPQGWDSEVSGDAPAAERTEPKSVPRPPRPPAPVAGRRQFSAPPLPVPAAPGQSGREFASTTSIEDELANLRGLVDQLSLERETITSSTDLDHDDRRVSEELDDGVAPSN